MENMNEMQNEEINAVVPTRKNNKYDNKEEREKHYKDSNYFNEYYQKTNIKIICPNCAKLTPKRNLSSHKKSMKCRFYTMKKQIEIE